jgi:hypothetical protein
MDRHNIPTHVLEIIRRTYIADCYLKACRHDWRCIFNLRKKAMMVKKLA